MSQQEFPKPPQDSRSARTPKPGSRVQASARPAPAGPEGGLEGSSPTVVRGSSTDSKRPPTPGASGPGLPPMPRPGETLGTFVLEEAIGAGGMGAVYRAHDGTLDRQVALKLLPPDQVDDPEVVLRFYQEGRSAARLDHENIARVYSLGQDGPYHYIVFEFVAGETIRRRVDDHGPMPVAEAVDVTLQIAEALVHASLRGVVHRDVKPSNIIITPEGRAKLVDMGLARRFERKTERNGLTQTGMTLGTFDYISPEQARDPRDVDVRSDLYSLGCTLFHMLTGQPPFPGGTVLQKLLQHQEEPPPNVVELNPAVPPALAKVLDKLMAKDRDRRCQSPEQLVRDLLQVAGATGMSLPHFETHAVRGAERPAWDRPRVPVTMAGFALLAAGLFYWGRELTEPPSSPPPVDSQPLRSTRGAAALPAPGTAKPAVATASRKIEVRPGEDLAAVLASAPHNSVITLNEDGPYLLSGRAPARGEGAKDVKIRAEVGKRPVLRFAAAGDRPASALLTFHRGRVSLEGLTFEADERALDDRLAAILLEDAELRLTGCTFRRPPGATPGGGLPAVRSRVASSEAAPGGRPPTIIADLCHFDPGSAAFDCEGPADLQFRDCTFGPGGTAVLLDDADAGALGPRDVSIERSSFMAGTAPVFQVRGSQARFEVDDCVFAPADPTTPARSLAAVDAPRSLAWYGRSNLYGRFESFLDVVGKPASEDAVRDFDRWRSDFRERRSTLATSPVWESTDPTRELAVGREGPSRAFRLASAAVGARKGPFGAQIVDPSAIRVAAGSPDPAPLATKASTKPASEPSAIAPFPTAPGAVAALAAAEAARPRPADATSTPMPTAPVETNAEPPSIPTMPPMANAEPLDDLDVDRPFEVASSEKSPTPTPAENPASPAGADRGAASRTSTPPAPPRASDEDLIRSVEQLQAVIAHHGDAGGVLHIAAGVDLELPTIELPPARWTIAAEPGERRPRLRFQPSPFGSASSAWASLLHVRGGELNLHGLDLVVQDLDPQSMGRLAAVTLAAGARLEMSDCTVSVSGQAPTRTAVAVLAPRGVVEDGPAPAAVVRIRDGFLRSAGDAVAVASNQRVDCRLENVVAAADGSLLHAMGRTSPAREEPTLTLNLERVLARAKGGLVHLESSTDEADLALAQVEVRDSILSTGADGAPLFRVDGRGRAEDLTDRIRWTGDNVGYHEITVYRADDSGQTGVPPKRYTRTDWINNFVARDDSPVFDVPFLDKQAPSRPARSLTPEALRLNPKSPLARKGPDHASIPRAPDPAS